jgi:tetratricopeptide (TPR) repeat protein
MKEHVRNFYHLLEKDRVSAAIIENERIEAIASATSADALRQRPVEGSKDVDRNWGLVRTAHQAAAENWISLGRYLAHKKRYDEAQGAYRRVLNTYTDPLYRPYLEQAAAGLQDVELILQPSKTR